MIIVIIIIIICVILSINQEYNHIILFYFYAIFDLNSSDTNQIHRN